ncbi:MAG: hypothetical protein ACOYO1_00810 [Bacteroidales bacterium]
MEKKHIYYYVLREHKTKIEAQTKFKPEICYQILASFSSTIRNNDGFVLVPAKKLQSIVYNYTPYINYLINEKIIYVDNQYQVGGKTRGYKLREIMHSDIIKIEATNTKFITDRIKCFNKNKNDKNNLSRTDHFKVMKDNFTTFVKELPIDEIMQDAQNIEDVNEKMAQFILLDKIKDNNLYFKRNTTNYRLDTNLTNLISNIKFYNPNNYTNLDFSNSQIYFLNILLQYLIKPTFNTTATNNNNTYLHNTTLTNTNNTNTLQSFTTTTFPHNDSEKLCNYSINQILNSRKFSYNTSIIDNNELDKFSQWTTSGRFYDNFVSAGTNRAEIKEMMFCVLFSKPSSFAKEKKIFSDEFPTINAFINDFKNNNGYKHFSILLQKIEARIVLDVICPLLVAAGIFIVTVHDSWIVKNDDVSKAIDIIYSVFDIKPHLKIESFDDMREQKIYEFKNNIRRLKIRHKKFNYGNPMIPLKKQDKKRFANLMRHTVQNKLGSINISV